MTHGDQRSRLPLLLLAFALGAVFMAGRSRARSQAQRTHDGERAARFEHDLRTPIGTIASAVTLIEGASDDAALRAEASRVIGRQVARLADLAQSLGEFGRYLGRPQEPPAR